MTIHDRVIEAGAQLRTVQRAVVLARAGRDKGFNALTVAATVTDASSAELNDALRTVFFERRAELMEAAVAELEERERAAERNLGAVALELAEGM